MKHKNKYELYVEVDKKQKRLEKKIIIKYLIERIKMVFQNE